MKIFCSRFVPGNEKNCIIIYWESSREWLNCITISQSIKLVFVHHVLVRRSSGPADRIVQKSRERKTLWTTLIRILALIRPTCFQREWFLRFYERCHVDRKLHNFHKFLSNRIIRIFKIKNLKKSSKIFQSLQTRKVQFLPNDHKYSRQQLQLQSNVHRNKTENRKRERSRWTNYCEKITQERIIRKRPKWRRGK